MEETAAIEGHFYPQQEVLRPLSTPPKATRKEVPRDPLGNRGN